jgi:phosphoadenosine phosphosulfate reductase
MFQCAVSQGTGLSLPLPSLDLAKLNQQFATAHPKSILLWCLETVPCGLVQSSAFGASGMVTLDLLYRDLASQPPVPVVFVDTLHHFPESLAHVKAVQAKYQVDLKIYSPWGCDSCEGFAAKYGHRLWERDLDQFQGLTKVEPFQRALRELGVQTWLTGRRRDQAQQRSQLPIFERDAQGRLKVNPLANWTHQTLWKYIIENQVPYNPLYDQGYASIGDEPLTTTIRPGETERSGRWRGTGRTECGIHTA